MSNRLLVGYLCYMNEANRKRRLENFNKSLTSMSRFKNQSCDVFAVKNNCTKEFSNKIDAQEGIDFSVSFDKNFWDISVLYATAKLARDRGYEYCMYTYDDFVVYRDDFVDDCMSYLDKNTDVGCVRVPKYQYDNMRTFDTKYTPKKDNPESLRHYNTVNNSMLVWQGPSKIGNSKFYKCNWHYTSRPTIWRTDVFWSFFDSVKSVPVMQPFEKYAAIEFNKTGLLTGVLDYGALFTFLESERTVSPESMGYGVKINLDNIDTQILKSL